MPDVEPALCARLQTVYNEEIFFLSHGEHKSAGVSARAMDIYLFMNSKVGPLELAAPWPMGPARAAQDAARTAACMPSRAASLEP